MNRLSRYRTEWGNDFREIGADIRGFGNRYRNEYDNFRQNWRQQIPADFANMRRGHAQAFNQGFPRVARGAGQGRDFLARGAGQGRNFLARGAGQARDFLGRNILGNDYNQLRCVQRRNYRGDHVHDDPFEGHERVPLRGRGPYMSGGLPFHNRAWSLS